MWSKGKSRSFESHQALLEHSPGRPFFQLWLLLVLNWQDLPNMRSLISVVLAEGWEANRSNTVLLLWSTTVTSTPEKVHNLAKLQSQNNGDFKINEKSEIFGKSMTNFLLDKQEWCIGESTFGLGLNQSINTIILWVEFAMFSCLFQKISLLIHAYLNQENDSS